MARGESYSLRTKKGFQICVVVAVPPFPFVDPDTSRKFSEDAAVLFKKPMTDGIHPCDVRLADGDWRLAGNSGYSLVVTGSGSTAFRDAKCWLGIISRCTRAFGLMSRKTKTRSSRNIGAGWAGSPAIPQKMQLVVVMRRVPQQA